MSTTAVDLLPKSGRKPLTPKNIQLRTPPTAQKLESLRDILPVLQISADNADESNKENFPSAGLKSKLYNLPTENLSSSSSSSSSSVSLESDHPHLCSPHECRTPFPAVTAIKRSGSTLDLKMEMENKVLIVSGEGLGKTEHLSSSSLSSCMGYGIDGSLAEKLKGVRERNDRLRVEKQSTSAVLAEREAWLKRMEEEMESRTKEQEKVEAELDLVMALNGLKNVIVCGPRQSLRDQKMMEKATPTTNGKDLQVSKEIERAEKFGQAKNDPISTMKKNIRNDLQLPVIATAAAAAQT